MCKANRMLNVIFQTINQLINRSIQKVRFPQSFSFTAYEMIKQQRLTDIPVRKALIHIFKYIILGYYSNFENQKSIIIK